MLVGRLAQAGKKIVVYNRDVFFSKILLAKSQEESRQNKEHGKKTLKDTCTKHKTELGKGLRSCSRHNKEGQSRSQSRKKYSHSGPGIGQS
ncbi:hypothetical protein ES705_37727 [subsurface metagenome]